MCFYCLFAASSSHLVSEHFPWHTWEFFFWAANFRSIYETFCTKSEETYCISEFLFQKYAVSKKNHLIWSSKSGDIADLKSTIFQNFGDGRGNCGEKIFWPSAQISISISWVEAKWLFQFRKHAIIEILSNIDPVFEHWVEFLPKFFLLQVQIWE